jgi:hypothetical protein
MDDPLTMFNFETTKRASYLLNDLGDKIENWYEDPSNLDLKMVLVLLNSIYSLLVEGQYSKKNSDDIASIFESYLSKNRSVITLKLADDKVMPTASYLGLDNEMGLSEIHQSLLNLSEKPVEMFSQELFSNSGIYDGLITMLEFDTSTSDQTDRPEYKVLFIKKIYRILARSLDSSLNNKQKILEHAEKIFMKHFVDLEADFNAYFLIK